MSRYVVIKKNIVDQVIVIDADVLMRIEDDKDVGKGDVFNPENNTFSKDPIIVARDNAATEERQRELQQE